MQAPQKVAQAPQTANFGVRPENNFIGTGVTRVSPKVGGNAHQSVTHLINIDDLTFILLIVIGIYIHVQSHTINWLFKISNPIHTGQASIWRADEHARQPCRGAYERRRKRRRGEMGCRDAYAHRWLRLSRCTVLSTTRRRPTNRRRAMDFDTGGLSRNAGASTISWLMAISCVGFKV